MFACLDAGSASAQSAPPAGVVAPGNAAVTGFSGALPPIQIAPGVDPAELTFIDVGGPSTRIVDLQQMSGPPRAQLVAAPKPFTWSAGQIGQVFAVVFGVALDTGTPPDIYVAATSAYGLPIVAPGQDGTQRHVRAGAPNATFMPGLWGAAAPNGGPGSIWKIDGVTGAISLFADVTLDGRANSGPALGGLAYDAASKSLYVADRETGMIHRFGPGGAALGRYDHGVDGRRAAGLPPVAFDPARRLDITNPQFDSAEPVTWNYAAPERLVFGLGISGRRLYYAVATGLQVWSVGLGSDGAFGSDATIELNIPPAAGPTEISKITFDEQSRMILAERPAPTGAFDFEALTAPGIGRVMRYVLLDSDPGAPRIWVPEFADYAIGFPLDQRNANGGAAIGYRYDATGKIDLDSCGGFLWSTGEELRVSSDPAIAARLAATGAADVDGLQGNETWRIRRYDPLPLSSYFIDYDDRFDDDAARGHMGDVAILRTCNPGRQAGVLVPVPGANPPVPPGPPVPPRPPGRKPPSPPSPPNPPTPPPPCPPGQERTRDSTGCQNICTRPNVRIGAKCCAPGDLKPGGACDNQNPGCGPGQTAIGPSNFCCNANQVYNGPTGAPVCCLTGPVSNGQCPSGTPPITGCASGYVLTGNTCCLISQVTLTGICCPTGTSPGGPNKSQCLKLPPIQIGGGQCCMAGQAPALDGKCCPINLLTTLGQCCPAGDPPGADRSSCPQQIQSKIVPACPRGYTKLPDGMCCNNRYLSRDRKSCRGQSSPPPPPPPPPPPIAPPTDCAARGPDFIRDPRDPHACVACGRGLVPNADRTLCIQPRHPAPADCAERGPNVIRNPRDPSTCIMCGRGLVANADHTACVKPATVRTPPDDHKGVKKPVKRIKPPPPPKPSGKGVKGKHKDRGR